MTATTTTRVLPSDPSAVPPETPGGCPVPDDRPPWHDADDGPRLTLPELIDHEALGYRAWGTPVGDFLARRMDELAQLVRWTHATTPDEHEARAAAWDAEVREQWEARGYEAGRLATCQCDLCR